MSSPVLLLLPFFVSQVYSDCFIDALAPGKRDLLHRSSAVDEFHCKILCYQNKNCLAYTFDQGLKGCAQLGTVSGHTCTLPTQEQLRKTKGCLKLDATSPVNGSYIQNPVIDVKLMVPIKNNTNTGAVNSIPCGVGWNAIELLMPDLSHRVVASYYAANIAWDAELGAWYYKDHLSDRIFIRAAACFSVPLADVHALDAAACAPLTDVRSSGYGPPSPPYNRSWPCDNSSAKEIWYLSMGGNENGMAKNQNYQGYRQTRGIIKATCT